MQLDMSAGSCYHFVREVCSVLDFSVFLKFMAQCLLFLFFCLWFLLLQAASCECLLLFFFCVLFCSPCVWFTFCIWMPWPPLFAVTFVHLLGTLVLLFLLYPYVFCVSFCLQLPVLYCFFAFLHFACPLFGFVQWATWINIIRLAFLSLFILGLVLIVFTSWFHCICMCFAFCICFLFLMSFLFSCCSMIQPALTLPSFSSACSTNLERWCSIPQRISSP